MCKPEKINQKEHGFRHHPFMRLYGHHKIGRPFMFGGLYRNPMKHMMDEIESKEEAIELLEIQIKRLNKQRKHLTKRMSRMDEMEKSIEETIGEIGNMKEFSKDEFKKILKKKYREFTNKMLDDIE
ncbi:MAG: hypothetical protein FK731_07350 [Asgard group archaeon]|nr:hypothetical protein [Asgard group archaeon]